MQRETQSEMQRETRIEMQGEMRDDMEVNGETQATPKGSIPRSHMIPADADI